MNEKEEEKERDPWSEGRKGLLIDWNRLLITNVGDRIEYMEKHSHVPA